MLTPLVFTHVAFIQKSLATLFALETIIARYTAMMQALM
jgi:hypothetical protein